MKAIYDYYNKNILPSLRLKEDQVSLDYDSVEVFVDRAFGAGVITGDKESFDLVEGMNLEKAAELLGYTEAQTYAFFAELDKYNVSSGSELSFLSQLDDSLDGRILNITSDIEELNRQKLALLEDGGYTKHKAEIDAINNQLDQCNARLDATGEEAYAMWQKYAENDVVLTALEAIEDKQQMITKEGATTLGLKWNEVSGKTIQQVYDEILAKQQELGEPTDLTLQFAQNNIEEELDALEKKLEEKKIDIEANVVWNEEKEQYEVTEGSVHAGDKDVQEYVRLSNEQYVLDGFLDGGLTATETYLSNIESILTSIYTDGVGNGAEEVTSTTDADYSVPTASPYGNVAAWYTDSEFGNKVSEFTNGIGNFFTETVPEVAGDVAGAIGGFFTETIPTAWDEYWSQVGESLSEFKEDISPICDIVRNFFTSVIPTAWDEFWAGAGDTLNEIGNDATELSAAVGTFFTETIPQKWEEFWGEVDDTITQDIPFAIGFFAGVVAKFFTKTIPEKWNEFWDNVEKFIDQSVDKAKALYDAVSSFITETIPEKWNEFWDNVSEFYEEVVDPAIDDVKKALSTFFSETLPTKWNEFWTGVGEFFTETIPTVVGNTKEAIYEFFTSTLPAKWNEFWAEVGQFISENIAPVVESLQNKLTTFFSETIPAKWNEFWSAVEVFLNETIPGAIQQFSDKITEFLTVTLPAKWSEFWTSIDTAFVTPIATALSTIEVGITTFFTVTVPSAINDMWTSLGSWIRKKASEVWSNLTSGFTLGFFGGGGVNGTAHAHGTAHARGTAHKSGDWGSPRTETALVGELGPEMVVRGNRWFTVGDSGAEFTDIKKGDIIFNHKQTESLLKNGYVTGRGKAYASGTAYNGLWNPVSPDTSLSNNPGNIFDTDSITGAVDEIKDDAKDVIDFIETKLEEIEAIISKTSAALVLRKDDTSTIKEKDSDYDKLVAQEQLKASTYRDAIERYTSRANGWLNKIPEQYRDMAQNGAIAIKDFSNASEETVEAINQYREWAAKADDAEVGYLESIAQQAAYRVEQLDDIATDFDNIIGLIEAESNLIQAEMDLVEASGERLSENYYNKLINNSNKIKGELEREKDALQKILDDAVAAGEVEKGTDEWYEMVNAIYEVDERIIQCDSDVEDFQNSINDLKWDNLDKLVSRFDAINDELSHLHERFTDNDDVVDDLGNWNEKGIAALGVLAQQMEVAQTKAETYGSAIDDLKKDYKKGLYSEDEYNEKLIELTESQWEAIEAYESAKDAIVDLNKTRIDAVKDGMEKELDAYQELIDKKKEALDTDKELYDFEKNVAEQQKEISQIERKLAALSGDTSASAAAQRKRLEAELLEAQAKLEDTYYERSIEQQKEALDNSYEQYEKNMNDEMEALDKYLENEEQVILDSLNTVKENTDTVLGEIKNISEQYGIDISNAITKPWEDGQNAISAYKEEFVKLTDSFAKELVKIKQQEAEIVSEANTTTQQATDNIVTNVKDVQSQEQGTQNIESTPYVDDDSDYIPGTKETTGGGGGGGVYVGGGGNGADIAAVQRALNSLGYNCGAVDGIFGPKTKAALMQFQAANGLAADGILGPLTMAKLESIIRRMSTPGGSGVNTVAKYAKGTLGTSDNEFAWIDEIGEELVLHADGNGRLSYLTKGSSVIPADLTAKLMDLALDPTQTLEQSRPIISAPHVVNNQFDIDMNFGSLVNIEHVDNNTIPDLTKAVEKQLDKYMKNLNGQIRKYAR